ncbi:Structure-specific endonuclease subunit SLX4, partial [Dissostichus eleginoides]
MDDSDQDFVDLCSKLLKRVRKKPGESKQPKRAEHQPSCQASDGDKRRRNTRRNVADSGSVSTAAADGEQPLVGGGTGHDAGGAEVLAVPSAAARQRAEIGLTAKDKVLHRMQQFKRASPQKMVHEDKSQPSHQETEPPHPLAPRQGPPESSSSPLPPDPQDGDEALALRLQQELDREAAGVQSVDLEEGGLFFCQICHRDLSHMTPEGRTQHLNRCLDQSEESAPAPPPPPPGVPDCPICGKKFKSQKSRSAHLKRCSSDMGVAPAVLLQALHRQTEETPNVPTTNTLTETGGNKRKGPSIPSLRPRKKSRKKTAPLDEDTLVALALSSSLLEQDRRSERETERLLQTAAPNTSMTPALKWRPDKGKGRGKRRKGGVPRPPPLLLVQDAQAALTRLQERRSSLLDGASTCEADFYTPELREFITPWEPAKKDAASSGTITRPITPVLPVSERAPVTGTGVSILPACTPQTAPSNPQTAPSTPGAGQLPAGSQAVLMELMELAEDGVTLTQYDKCGSQITTLRLSGFVLEEPEEPADLGVSGFLPETAHTHPGAHSRARRRTDPPGADQERQTAAQSRLTSDLSSMVNNPQLSDLQLQVDSGDVFFTHSFMVYARCPLLAEMEEGSPAAQRVLMNDVPGQAVLALLQYLYTARCSIPPALQPHVLELASRFDLQELQQLCEPEGFLNQEEDANDQMQQTLSELLRSIEEEKVNEEELEEIYDLERSYSRLFSDSWGVYEEDPPSVPSTSGLARTHTPQAPQSPQSPHIPSLHPSGRTLLQSSAISPQKNEPELIVLSDSSEDMEVVLISRSPSPPSPYPVQTQTYTQIKPNDPTLENKQSGSLELSPDAEPGQSPSDLFGCSPEVSWLIPSTPLHTKRVSSSSSTQTQSSMCRTQLFPKADPSSLSSFSPPALPSNDRPHTSNSPTRASSRVSPTEANALKLDFSSRRSSSSDASKDRGVFAVPLSQPKPSISSKQGTPLHLQTSSRPYSSTPLHTELHKAPALLTTSPLHSSFDRSWTSQGKDRAPCESQEKTELGSFHLSPLSDPSDPPSSSSLRGRQRHSESSSHSRRSVDSHSKTGSEMEGRGMRLEEGQGETECGNRGDEAETGEALVTESSFRQSFMDEPPMAFNDSWGLGACGDEDPGCFSLRLEDSGASSQGKGPPSSTERQPPPPSLRPAPSSSKSTAHKDVSFTPSPPDPPTHNTPEI